MKRWKWAAGMGMMLVLIARPEAAANGARAAMAQWYATVAPSLFPFLALMPLLTCEPALRFYERSLGGLTRRAFGLPGAAASAMAVGLLAGSPAGSAAACRAARGGCLRRGQLERLGAACCGLSPGFLISGVGAAMLGDASMGHLLLRSQWIAQFSLLALTRRAPAGGEIPAPPPERRPEPQPVRDAVLSVMTVCGYMALFGAMAAVAGEFAGEAARLGLLCAMDVTSGAQALSALEFGLPAKLAAISAVTGFGGACVCAQNLSALGGCGVRTGRFVAMRLAAGALSAAITLLQLSLGRGAGIRAEPSVFHAACLCACAAALPALWSLKRTVT